MNSDYTLSEQLEKEQENRILLIFSHLGVKPETEVLMEQILNSIDSIEAESGTNLLGTKETFSLRHFAKDNPKLKFNLEELKELLSKISYESSLDLNNSSSRIFNTPRSRDRRASTLSDRIRGSPLPEFSPSVSSINFHRPASPSQTFFSRSLSNASGRLSPFLRQERSSPDLNLSSHSNHRPEAYKIFNLTNSRCASPTGLEHLELSHEPGLDASLNTHGFEKKMTKTKLGQQQVRRVNSELNKKLEEAEDTLSKISSEAAQRISRAESELRATKIELSQKKKNLFDFRSEVRVQAEQIEVLEKDKKDLHCDLVNYKKLYFQTKKQLESLKGQKSQIAVTSKTRLEELEETIKKYQASHQDQQELITRCNNMTKTIANLERDVTIAQSVAKNFDELVQENFQLKENIESLQKSLAETYQPQPQSTSGLDLSLGLRLNAELSGSNYSLCDESSPIHPHNSSGIFPPRHEILANSRQLKELEKENRYLKRHIDKTWGQWDRVKGDLVVLVNSATNETIDISQQRLGSILLRMDRYRPAKAYPTFKRASIQQILIDDRPALSSNDNSSFASPAIGRILSSDSNNSNASGLGSSVSTPTTLKASISDSIMTKPTVESVEVVENSIKITEDTINADQKYSLDKVDAPSDYTDQLLEKLASTPSSLKSTALADMSCSSFDSGLSDNTDYRSITNSSSSLTSQAYLARRALKKSSGPRVIKKVSFAELYENEDSAATRESLNSSFVLSSQLNSPPLPLPNALEDVSEPPPHPPLDNLLKIGEVPSYDTLNRLNEAALKAYMPTNRKFEKVPSKLATTSPPRPKESKSYVLLIVYAVVACIFTFWTSPSKEPLLMDAPSLRDEEEKEKKKDNVLENVTRHSSLQSSSRHGYEVRLGQDVLNNDSNLAASPEVNYRDNSSVFLKFWVEMLILGGAFPSE